MNGDIGELWRAFNKASKSTGERLARLETRQETLTKLSWAILAALVLSQAGTYFLK